jgi:hypothetical protein
MTHDTKYLNYCIEKLTKNVDQLRKYKFSYPDYDKLPNKKEIESELELYKDKILYYSAEICKMDRYAIDGSFNKTIDCALRLVVTETKSDKMFETYVFDSGSEIYYYFK